MKLVQILLGSSLLMFLSSSPRSTQAAREELMGACIDAAVAADHAIAAAVESHELLLKLGKAAAEGDTTLMIGTMKAAEIDKQIDSIRILAQQAEDAAELIKKECKSLAKAVQKRHCEKKP